MMKYHVLLLSMVDTKQEIHDGNDKNNIIDRLSDFVTNHSQKYLADTFIPKYEITIKDRVHISGNIIRRFNVLRPDNL